MTEMTRGRQCSLTHGTNQNTIDGHHDHDHDEEEGSISHLLFGSDGTDCFTLISLKSTHGLIDKRCRKVLAIKRTLRNGVIQMFQCKKTTLYFDRTEQK